MKYLKTMVVAAALVCAAASSQAQLSFPGLSYSQNNGGTGGQINFSSGGFTFTGPSGNSFQIATSSANGDAAGDLGSIAGTFTIGTIVGNSAPVTSTPSGGGTLTILGNGGAKLTGTLSWVNIVQTGTTVGLDSVATANLTGLSFTGPLLDNSKLFALAQANAIDTLAFTFSGSLAQLQAGTATPQTSFSGNIWNAAVPEPTTIVAGSLLLLPFGLSALRIIRNKKTA